MSEKRDAGPRAHKRISLLDRYLTLWIFSAMGLGLVLGSTIKGFSSFLGSLSVGTTSLPIAVGLLLMMYPPLAGVRYEELTKLRNVKRMFSASLLLNWLVGPLLMFALAWIFLPDLPQYRTGLILTGLARCIAMVIVWNKLADGDNDYAAVLVALNSVFQVAFYSVYAFALVTVLSSWVSAGGGTVLNISVVEVAQTVLVFLALPFVGGIATRLYLLPRKGASWYNGKFLKTLHPTSLVALLFTITVMFSLKGDFIMALPLDVLRVALPLVCYFVIMFLLSVGVARALRLDYPSATAMCFTAASNNFELAIAVAVGVFGINSGVAFATIIGPLIEVPVMIGLVNVALRLRPNWMGAAGRKEMPVPAT